MRDPRIQDSDREDVRAPFAIFARTAKTGATVAPVFGRTGRLTASCRPSSSRPLQLSSPLRLSPPSCGIRSRGAHSVSQRLCLPALGGASIRRSSLRLASEGHRPSDSLHAHSLAASRLRSSSYGGQAVSSLRLRGAHRVDRAHWSCGQKNRGCKVALTPPVPVGGG
jgi:hypothetical protein